MHRLGRYLIGFAILYALQLAGGAVARLLHVPVPGSVIGMLLLTAALRVEIVRVALVRPMAELLLEHLGLLYVPAGAALLLYVGLLRASWLPILVASVASTLAVLLVVGTLQQRLRRGWADEEERP